MPPERALGISSLLRNCVDGADPAGEFVEARAATACRPSLDGRCSGLERRRRPTVPDARPLRILEEVVAVEWARFSCLRPSASRYALVYLPAKGIVASLELCRAVRVPWRRCWPEGKSACRKHQGGGCHNGGRPCMSSHSLTPSPCATCVQPKSFDCSRQADVSAACPRLRRDPRCACSLSQVRLVPGRGLPAARHTRTPGRTQR